MLTDRGSGAKDGPESGAVTGAGERVDPGVRAGSRRGRAALGARGRAILDFERTWWLEGTAKEPLIRERFGVSATRYYKLLAALIDTPEAKDYDPLVVLRLRKLRDRRRRARYEGKPADGTPRR